jgi:hypothetical protein
MPHSTLRRCCEDNNNGCFVVGSMPITLGMLPTGCGLHGQHSWSLSGLLPAAQLELHCMHMLTEGALQPLLEAAQAGEDSAASHLMEVVVVALRTTCCHVGHLQGTSRVSHPFYTG